MPFSQSGKSRRHPPPPVVPIIDQDYKKPSYVLLER